MGIIQTLVHQRQEMESLKGRKAKRPWEGGRKGERERTTGGGADINVNTVIRVHRNLSFNF